MVTLLAATTDAHIQTAGELFREYARSLPFALDFQDFDAELSDIGRHYAPPRGRLYIALVDDEPAGCVALRYLEEGVCEMKRLYVRPRFRGRHVGRQLAVAVIAAAREIGYDRMLLDTVPAMKAANGLYATLGFKPIDAYRFNPVEGAVYLGLVLKEGNGVIRNADEADIGLLAGIIRYSHADVARRFILTSENCPKHPSNCTAEWIENDLARGIRYFLADWQGKQVGCVALEKAGPDMCYLERLSVLPENRRHGIGRRLVERVIHEASDMGVPRIGIGIIADFLELKTWYRQLGFLEGETRTFAHLPFKVLLMAYELP